jgi:hypothetical protein
MLAKKFFLGGKVNAPLDPTLQAVIDFADANSITRPTGLTLSALNRLIIKEKNNGNFATNDVYLNFIYNNDTLADFSRICWKRLILVDVYVATYSATRGWQGVVDNPNRYIDTLFNPVTAGGNFTQNNAHIGGVVSFQYSSGATIFTGLESTNFRNLYNANVGTGNRLNTTSNTGAVTVDGSGIGYKMMSRLNVNDCFYRNRNLEFDTVQTANSFVSQKQMIMRMNLSYGAIDVGQFTMGGTLTKAQADARRQNLKDYYNEIGLTTLANAI